MIVGLPWKREFDLRAALEGLTQTFGSLGGRSPARPDGRRRVNLDPGLLSLNALVLASTKPAPHRIYLDREIHTQLELIYQRGRFEPLPWTYPDYSGEEFLAWLTGVRKSLKADLKRAGSFSSGQPLSLRESL